MDAQWIKSPTARRVLAHWADARPAWLWSQNGERLLWLNAAARLFRGKLKKHGVKLAPLAVPIKGQVARLVRLGSIDRPSLSRIQLLAGDKPVSITCIGTPVILDDGTTGMLLVGVDPIAPELLASEPVRDDSAMEDFFPCGAEYVLVDADGRVVEGSPAALARHGAIGDKADVTDADDGLTRFGTGRDGLTLVLFDAPVAPEEPRSPIDAIRSDEGIGKQAEAVDAPPVRVEDEPLLPLGLTPIDQEEPTSQPVPEGHWVEPLPDRQHPEGTLSGLFDRLIDDAGLYTALGDEDGFPAEPAEASAPADERSDEPSAAGAADDPIGAMIAELDNGEASAPVTAWRVIGRGFTPIAADGDTSVDENAPAIGTLPAGGTMPDAPDAETVERVSRYNFDELSRILADRVSAGQPADAPEQSDAESSPSGPVGNHGETFILNRLPLGIMVFRDQQILFANRSMTELTGYQNLEGLRAAGLSAVFPGEETSGGPVTHLVRRDGSLASVNARLQTINWQGRPAVMLSASLVEAAGSGHEAAVKAFAELAATTGEDGYFTLDRAGTIRSVSLHGRVLLGGTESELVGRPVSAFVAPGQVAELQRFLERPARFAETERPSILLDASHPDIRLALFSEGQAGVVAGYFGLVRKLPVAAEPGPRQGTVEDIEPSLLMRISRGVRRPLNSIIGFADLIRSGVAEPGRQQEYARDIRAAGEEIASLVDELDSYAGLRDGRYKPSSDDIDLVALLDRCLARVRVQATGARVLVRSAVSEALPRVAADRASLSQAILNLMASAIDQTPAGGTVILSAQREEDGAIVINVRDNGARRTDLGERFVVFRDGVGRDGEVLMPVRSSVGLALTRSLLAVNALKLNVDPAAGVGTLFSLVIPMELTR